jgi:50S ribosomal protein L16 3-hydroxylase
MDILGNISREQFLKEYWQKKPLLIRQAYPDFQPILEADELAGMSLEEDVESRIIMEQGPDSPWQLLAGPLDENTFSQLPKDKWTLLLQGVDQWLPEAADLLQNFNFIPNWRIDDLMISFATDGGSVGPHYDQYDVFLLQAEGQREWRIGQMCSEQDDFLSETKLRILSQFNETQRWLLEPGDMLYLPPRLAHYGIAKGNCQTYSIGFRAPSHNELIQSLAQQLELSCNEDQRYSDPDLELQENSGLISPNAISKMREFLQQALDNSDLLADTLGKLMTGAKYPSLALENQYQGSEKECAEDFNELLQAIDIERDLQARFAFTENCFYAGGQAYPINDNSQAMAKYLCQQRYYHGEKLTDFCKDSDNQQLLLSLFKQGYLFHPH